MARSFCIPGIIILTLALVLMLLTTISLPYVSVFDVSRVYFNGQSNSTGNGSIDEVRLGVWGWCAQPVGGGGFSCVHAGHAYSLLLTAASGGKSVTIGSSWTRGLLLHPIATGVIFVAWLLSFSDHLTVTLFSSAISFFAALLTLIAFAIDIALYVYLKDKAKDLGVAETTDTGPAFWFTLVSFILLLIAGCVVCFGRRRDRVARGYSYNDGNRGWFKRKQRTTTV